MNLSGLCDVYDELVLKSTILGNCGKPLREQNVKLSTMALFLERKATALQCRINYKCLHNSALTAGKFYAVSIYCCTFLNAF